MQYIKTIGSLALAGYLSLAQGCGTIAGACKGAYYGAKNDYKALVETFSGVKDTTEEKETSRTQDSQSQLSNWEKYQRSNGSLQDPYDSMGRTPAR